MTYLIAISNNSKSYLFIVYFIVYLEVEIILFSYVCNYQKVKTHGKARLFAFIPTSSTCR